MKKILSLVLVLMLVISSAAFAEIDWSQVKSVDPYDEMITITSARTMDATFEIDESDPDKKSYTENRWLDTFREKLNINVEYAWISTDNDSNNAKWGAAIASGNVPDFAVVSDQIYKQLVEADMVYDCTEIYEKYISDMTKEMIDPLMVSSMTYDGKLLGLPKPGNKYIGNAMCFVRTDWLAKLNLEVPTTLPEVLEVARAFKEAKLGGEDTIGILFADGAGVNDGRLQGFMNSYGAYRSIWVVDAEGKLAWSDTLPEMRDALLALQELYAEGLINQDFAVTNGTVAQEYVASGKVGVWWATDYATTMSIQAMHDLEPEANVAIVGIPGLTEEDLPKIQTGAITCGKFFISKNCKNPEAVAKMINMHVEMMNSGVSEWYYAYESGEDGYLWFKQLPWGDHFTSAINDITKAYEMRSWWETGVKEETYKIPSTSPTIDKIAAGTGAWWYGPTYGLGGSYQYDYDMYAAGRQQPNMFNDLPTDTMAMLGDVVNDALNTAMLEVICGADISVYDKAIENWFASGGQMITDEVNDWYASK